jgi:hypothetical protein
VRGQTTLEARAGTVFVLCSTGPVMLRIGPEEAQLDGLDAVTWTGGATMIGLASGSDAEVFVVELQSR